MANIVRVSGNNETCKSPIDMDLFLHYSLIPSAFIILVLSFLHRRINKMRLDEKMALLNRRFGLVMPLDFIGTFSNRWSYGFAFGGMANKVMILFSEEYLPFQAPTWAKAIVVLVGALEVGFSYYPIFACLSTGFKLVGSVLGFLYTLTWFILSVWDIASCPNGEIIGDYQKLIINWPSLLCLAFLMARFVHIFVKALSVHLGLVAGTTEASTFLQEHQTQHVLQLLKKVINKNKQKSWFQLKIYDWDPHFKYPSRMVGTAVLALICLYIFVVVEYYSVMNYAFSVLNLLKEEFEKLMSFSNDTQQYLPSIVQMEEFVSVAQTTWTITTFLSCGTSVSYVIHILVCYRKHIKRLWVGERSFLAVKFQTPKSSESVAAIARYSGWQIAYIMWGYFIMHIVQFLFGLFVAYSFALPIKHGQGLQMLKGYGIGVLTIGIVIALMIIQVMMASTFFLQKKISPEDKGKPLALNNRKAFHTFNYFFFFYNVILGIGACLFRLLCSFVLGTWLVARIDRTIMQKGHESPDMGYATWVGMIFVDHYHTNPVLVCFCHILLKSHYERKLQIYPEYSFFPRSSGTSRVSPRARTRWLLLYTLLNNPKLILLRKQQSECNSREIEPHGMARDKLALAYVFAANWENICETPHEAHCVNLSQVRVRVSHDAENESGDKMQTIADAVDSDTGSI
ncbi:stimulated by retinoic acid gene 6 protein-like [Protopterus annectens]|uniref:stimulated by retinoic acid gene 6 protein-like n=1 Tax=Protopterus annectens TaxID=7888 RepID=UPI001CFBA177|nr:stimulated by retinoic acid gene 6 protein-like [Protopterus annectens]